MLVGAQKEAFLIILEQEIGFQNHQNRPILAWREGELVERRVVIGRECDVLPVRWQQTAHFVWLALLARLIWGWADGASEACLKI